MSISLLPRTKLGKWCVGLLVACVAIHFLLIADVPFVRLVIQSILALAVITLGIVSIVKNKERAILAYFSVAVCLLILLFPLAFVLGERLFPHD